MEFPDPVVTSRVDIMHEGKNEIAAVIEIGGVEVFRHVVKDADMNDYAYEARVVQRDAEALFGKAIKALLEKETRDA
jgi:hypothetical protein